MRALLLVVLVGCASATVPRGFHEVNDPSLRQIVAGTVIAAAGFALAAYAAPSGSSIDGRNGNAMVSGPAALVGVAGAGLALRGLAYARLEPDPPDPPAATWSGAPGSR
jgi:hypothetical protein